MKKILITYYSATGNTKNAADTIKDVLTHKGMQVDILPFSKVGPLTDYQGVIVGSPVNAMQWQSEAEQFIIKNAAALQDIPTLYFALSAFWNGNRPFLKKAISGVFKKAALIKEPLSTAVFPGIIPDTTPGFLFRVAKIDKGIKGRTQDLEVVKQWAEDIQGLI